jgi:hypothetical protein
MPVDAVLSQIAFSRRGLTAPGIKGSTQDPRFEHRPMYLDRAELGNQGKWVNEFENGSVHGVFMIVAHGAYLHLHLC